MTLPGTAGAVNVNSGSFRIVGVSLDANGKTGPQSLTATLNVGVNNYVLATTSPTVINNIGPGISTFAIGSRCGQPNQGTATIRTNSSGTSVPDPTGSFILTEGCAGCWRTRIQSGNSETGPTAGSGSQIRLTFNNIPAGVTLNLAVNTAAGLAVT